MAAPQQMQIQVVRELNNEWLECIDDQGLYYFNKISQQAVDEMPAEAGAAPQYAQVQPQVLQDQAPVVQEQAPQAPALRKMIIGQWSVMEDANGIFFHNAETQQQSNEVPPEIAQVYAKVAYTGGQMVLPTAQPVPQQQFYQAAQPQQLPPQQMQQFCQAPQPVQYQQPIQYQQPMYQAPPVQQYQQMPVYAAQPQQQMYFQAA
mmetsp:Transcript_171/g.385  ORF Transcript_171/g.385 Transcript_171/m.385 type:complete len:204 (-) Transcript_171:155-766(-)|eukprot:CAMPEP_0197648406 /NCGR_PEP_ID=MMETSP1338-20131121/27736_1 /TAXON_ID=43686 ORGANISM="Pelagodinium beii, Strain RCC1491" /NCGR_SAMPLE_ID=MMETSP1338 /ASSEMBLY_ACC=CAM_ASM_000754 /LENGTH=203 /DNA_ID=CAMNT_0043222395 /DNA_START=66 /DNA_END=677 /DNA_ORIENTATION=-